jgi:hypothetical protein
MKYITKNTSPKITRPKIKVMITAPFVQSTKGIKYCMANGIKIQMPKILRNVHHKYDMDQFSGNNILKQLKYRPVELVFTMYI